MTKRNLIYKTIPYFSTFSGIGGFERALELAVWLYGNEAYRTEQRRLAAQPCRSLFGALASVATKPTVDETVYKAQCVGFSEVDKFAAAVYSKHYQGHKNYGDITQIKENTLPNFNLLVGGFPCQSYSQIGQRGGLSDPRGQLFFDLARIIKAKQPKVLVLENVPALLSADQGRAFATILNTLSELGYFVEWQVLNSNEFGSPQVRKRIIIVGLLGGKPAKPLFPIEPHSSTHFDAARIVSYSKLRDKVSIRNTSSTIIASYRGTGGYNEPCVLEGNKVRRFSPLECERLQGFPDGWTAYGWNGEEISTSQRYHQLGNAVNVNMLQTVFTELLKNTSYRAALFSN